MRIIVGLSGGVDSSVTAYLLRKKGYEVSGIVMYHIDDFDIEKVRYVAKLLNIPLIEYDIRNEFRKKIIEPFIKEYMLGKTPNPCIMCNPFIKFGILKNYALKYGDMYATGHYVRIEKKDGKFFIKKAKDKEKDQSYFLYRLTQKDLEETIFPLGDYTKEEVKKIGESLGIKPKKESQDICFIKDGYQIFIKDHVKKVKEGKFIDTKGKVLGTHKGIPFYTIGQRRGLGISSTERLYVVKILSSKNKIILGPREKLLKKEFEIDNIASCSYSEIPEGTYDVKIRYNTPSKRAKIKYISKTRIRVILEEEEYAITPGQSAVFYKDDYLIGGGIIQSSS